MRSRKAGAAAEEGVRWESGADGDFTVETVTLPERGTAVTLHLKADAKEFADAFRLRSLIRRYSDHIGFPVRMRKEGEASLEYEVVNQAKALWTLPRTRDHGRGIQAVLPVPGPRLHRPARLEPQQGRGQARVHEPAVRARRAPRSTCGSATPRAA